MKKVVYAILTITAITVLLYVVSNHIFNETDKRSVFFSSVSNKISSTVKMDFSKIKLIYENDMEKVYYHKLSTNAKIAYTLILNKIEEQPEQIEIPNITNEELDKLLYSLSYDNPELLSIGRKCKVESNKTGTKFYFKMNYDFSKEEKNIKEAELNKKINEIISGMPSGSSYDQELYIHDYVCKNCVYDADTEQYGTSYDALVDGKAVCEGYARAIKVLLDRIKIKNYLITGKAANKSGKVEPHMWNIVEINGKRFHLDATWDDINLGGGEFCHLYFNMSDEEIKFDHYELIPMENNCYDNSQSYFKNEGLWFDKYNESLVHKILIKEGIKNLQNGRQSVEIRFANKSSFNDCCKTLVKSSRIYEVLDEINENTGTKYKNISYFESEELNFIEFFFS